MAGKRSRTQKVADVPQGVPFSVLPVFEAYRYRGAMLLGLDELRYKVSDTHYAIDISPEAQSYSVSSTEVEIVPDNLELLAALRTIAGDKADVPTMETEPHDKPRRKMR